MIKFFYGDEPYLIRERIRTEISGLPFPEMNLRKSSCLGKEDIEFLSMSPMFSDKRILVLELDALPGLNVDLLQGNNNLVLLSIRKVDERTKEFKALRPFIIPCGKLNETQLTTFVLKQVKFLNRKITEPALRMFIERIGYFIDPEVSLFSAKTAIQQIGYAGDVTEENVSIFLEETIEKKVFNLSSFVLEGRGSEAHKLLSGLLRDGESSIKILSVLMQKYRIAMKYAQEASCNDIGITTLQLGRFSKVSYDVAQKCFSLLVEGIEKVKEGEAADVVCNLLLEKLLVEHGAVKQQCRE